MGIDGHVNSDNSYLDIVEKLLAIIQLHSYWDTSTSAAGDYSQVVAGVPCTVEIIPGEALPVQNAGGMITRKWEFICDLDVRVHGMSDLESFLYFAQYRDAFIRHVESYPTLNGQSGVTSVSVMARGRVLPITDAGDDNDMLVIESLLQELAIIVSVRYQLTGGEYA